MSKLSNILITGGKGMVGSQIDFGIKLDKSQFDILSPKSIQEAIKKYKPGVIFHLAAMTDMLECENNPDLAYKINVIGSRNIAEACRKNKIKLVYPSTCAIFDGKKLTPYKETDKPNPINVYGKTKWQGELQIKKLTSDYLIIRTGWLFGGGPKMDKKFVFSTFQKIKRGLEVKATSNRFGSPTYIPDLLQEIKKLIDKNAKGIFHVVNSGTASYFEIAREIKKIGKFSSRIIPVKAYEVENAKLKRATMEALSSSKIKLRHWKKSLRKYIDLLAII